MDVQIRRANTEDAVALWPLCRGFGLFLTDGSDPETPRTADLVRLRAVLTDADQHVAVAEADGTLVGSALAQDYGVSLRRDGSVARLHDLFVTPAARREGVARALHAAVVEWCATRPVRFLEWQASASAVTFHERLGFAPDRTGDFAEHPFFEHDFTVADPPR